MSQIQLTMKIASDRKVDRNYHHEVKNCSQFWWTNKLGWVLGDAKQSRPSKDTGSWHEKLHSLMGRTIHAMTIKNPRKVRYLLVWSHQRLSAADVWCPCKWMHHRWSPVCDKPHSSTIPRCQRPKRQNARDWSRNSGNPERSHAQQTTHTSN